MYGFYLHEVEHGTISNNMIALDNNNLTTSVQVIGLYHTCSSIPTTDFFYNSVVLSGTDALGAFSAAFFRNYINSLAPDAQIRNNIFYIFTPSL